MKYSSLKKSSSKQFSISLLDGGVNKTGSPLNMRPDQMKSCENMWLKEGALRTRPALKAAENGIILDNQYNDYILQYPIFSNTEVYKNGQKRSLCYMIITDAMSYYQLKTFLVDENGAAEDYGTIHFNRVSSTVFNAPSDVFFTSGSTVVGDGVFAFVKTCSEAERYYTVYEHTADEDWKRLMGEEWYIPTIYINGRGNDYEKALVAGSAYEPEPERPEELNMLTPKFKAYFSSDGFSTSFNLPVIGIDDDTVFCRIYHTPESYGQWQIESGEASAVSSFFGAKVTMKCNRETGTISFFFPNGEPYEIPKMSLYGNNNIFITASKSLPDGAEKIFTSKGCISYNSRLYLYGNDVAPSEIYSAKQTNPLYFPKNSKTSVGISNDAVTAMAVQNAKIIAFKQNEMYKINVISPTKLKNTRLFEDDYGDPGGVDKLEAINIHPSIGCDNAATLSLCGNRLVWMGSDNCIYTLATTTYGNQNNVYKISDFLGNSISQELSGLWRIKANAISFNGYYMLFIKDKAFVMDYKVRGFGYSETFSGLRNDADKVSWYCWSFPEGIHISSADVIAGKIRLACQMDSDYVSYISTLDTLSDCDILLLKDDNVICELGSDIAFGFETALLDFNAPYKQKFIDSVTISIKASEEICCAFGGDVKTKKAALKYLAADKPCSIKIKPYLPEVERVSLKLEGKGIFEMGELNFSYRERSD